MRAEFQGLCPSLKPYKPTLRYPCQYDSGRSGRQDHKWRVAFFILEPSPLWLFSIRRLPRRLPWKKNLVEASSRGRRSGPFFYRMSITISQRSHYLPSTLRFSSPKKLRFEDYSVPFPLLFEMVIDGYSGKKLWVLGGPNHPGISDGWLVAFFLERLFLIFTLQSNISDENQLYLYL
jgi:hypothetical protein